MTAVFVTGGSGYLGLPLIRALRAAGHSVRAMARSSESARQVTAAGAEPAECDLRSEEALVAALAGCNVVVHAAGRFREGGGYPAYFRDNVLGTRNVLNAARSAGAARFLYVGAAGCLIGRRPVVDADESWPLQEPGFSPYFRTKTMADREVLAADAASFTTSVVRPGLIWGGDNDPLLDAIAQASRKGKFMLVDGGRHLIVTSHVDNTVRAILDAVERGGGGESYYVFDDGRVTLREFFGSLLATRDLPAPEKSIPYGLAWVVASILDGAWALFRRPGAAPISRELVRLNGGPFLVSDRKARTELGYIPVVSRGEGIARLAKLKASAPPRDFARSTSTESRRP